MGKPLFGHLMQLTTPARPGGPPTGAAGGDLAGSTYPNPAVTPAVASKWQVIGPVLTPIAPFANLAQLDTTGDLAVGARLIKTRLMPHPVADAGYVTCNAALISSGASWSQDDGTKPGWAIAGNVVSDLFQVLRVAAGASVTTTPLSVDNAGNLVIAGPTAVKAAPGTAWVNPSDPRLKRDVGPYQAGLEAIRQLHPITFKYNGLGETCDDGTVCHGFDTAAVASVMPECIRTLRRKLHPDDAEETDIAAMDVSDILLALVNAVKELATRVAALEGKP